jgi:hypothetical protein
MNGNPIFYPFHFYVNFINLDICVVETRFPSMFSLDIFFEWSTSNFLMMLENYWKRCFNVFINMSEITKYALYLQFLTVDSIIFSKLLSPNIFFLFFYILVQSHYCLQTVHTIQLHHILFLKNVPNFFDKNSTQYDKTIVRYTRKKKTTLKDRECLYL